MPQCDPHDAILPVLRRAHPPGHGLCPYAPGQGRVGGEEGEGVSLACERRRRNCRAVAISTHFPLLCAQCQQRWCCKNVLRYLVGALSEVPHRCLHCGGGPGPTRGWGGELSVSPEDTGRGGLALNICKTHPAVRGTPASSPADVLPPESETTSTDVASSPAPCALAWQRTAAVALRREGGT